MCVPGIVRYAKTIIISEEQGREQAPKRLDLDLKQGVWRDAM